MKIVQEQWTEVDGRPIIAYTFTNDNGIEVTCINYGCIITKIVTPDRHGNYENIVLAFDDFSSYLTNHPYLGAVIGRVAGRIKNASFELNGKTYTLYKNENGNHLHGGKKGFHHAIWQGAGFSRKDEVGVQFSYTSPDGEEGYPGNVDVHVTYTLNNQNELTISYRATSDKDTPITLTNHTYFNLSGNVKSDILQHQLKIKSDRFLELDHEFLPTGALLDVTGTPFDLREGKTIKEGVEATHPQIVSVGQGYDHPFLLNTHHDEEIVLLDPESGRTLIVETDEPGVVVYTGNQLPSEIKVNGAPARKYLGICLETQALPDAVHHSHFPSCILRAGEMYSSVTKYTFRVHEEGER
ncbi:aldose 1-epimerase [Anoxybacillus voinovskiensis]|uniref:Aldose 1-epimerase n=1 Tax=Anoxybacteroides voinovskiense TaxID=230470 RepID=A0A840DQH9_9BACL|nr:aldose epimerase family protein [Anoxybacillus voinovskiensis]MBB4072407.1 aldose 1-epimerase [Anoxybacillus voinovskiensis]GGJ58128.1 aldose 1-epimerase [Anoxybacillus voinovskiensis]